MNEHGLTGSFKHTGDAPILAAAQVQIRNEFRQKASLDPADASVPAAIQHAEQVAKVLRENVVQGKKIEEGQDKYSTLQLRQTRQRSIDLRTTLADINDTTFRTTDTRAY